ncbi:MAG: hypothetical protein WAT74_13925 [Flavobacteriales bacterium]
MRFTVLWMAFSLLVLARAQELVPNGGFEDVLQCPDDHSQLDRTASWFDPSVNGTPDYFHACATNGWFSTPQNVVGSQEPVDGEAYAGIYLYEGSQVLNNWREYLQVGLMEALVAERCYRLILHANLSNNSSRTTDALGVRFYSDSVLLPNPYPPGDMPHLSLAPGTFLTSDSWTVLEGEYIATGEERFLMIGNYRDNANTTVQQLSTNGSFAYAYIDAVSLTPCTSLGLGQGAPRTPIASIVGGHLCIRDPGLGAMRFRLSDATGRIVADGMIQDECVVLRSPLIGVYVLELTDGSARRVERVVAQ